MEFNYSISDDVLNSTNVMSNHVFNHRLTQGLFLNSQIGHGTIFVNLHIPDMPLGAYGCLDTYTQL